MQKPESELILTIFFISKSILLINYRDKSTHVGESGWSWPVKIRPSRKNRIRPSRKNRIRPSKKTGSGSYLTFIQKYLPFTFFFTYKVNIFDTDTLYYHLQEKFISKQVIFYWHEKLYFATIWKKELIHENIQQENNTLYQKYQVWLWDH